MIFVRANFRHLYDSENCPLCLSKSGKISRDSQEHLLECEVLKENSDLCETGTKYEEIFSDHLETNVTKL